MARILIVDDDENICRVVARVLQQENHTVETMGTYKDLRERLERQNIDVVFLDIHLPDKKGDEAIIEMKQHDPLLQVIIVTGDLSVERAVSAIKNGAADYITKPFTREAILHVTASVLRERKNQVQEVTRQRDPLTAIAPSTRLLGTSRKMCNVNLILNKIAQTPFTPALIVGESGTGKELAAQAIHQQSARKDNPLVRINCAAIPRPLVESELFGHEAGAFTDARAMRKGLFELADGGTIFLDEVGELDLSVQPKLLRVLEDRTVTRVGSGVSRSVDIRIIAATNRDLPAMCQLGTFRKDLYFRLAVMTIQMPPLRKHIEDIEIISNSILRQKSIELGRKVIGFSETVMNFFRNYSWPGNVRELKNMIERLIILSDGDVIHFEERHLRSLSFMDSNGDVSESSFLQSLEPREQLSSSRHGSIDLSDTLDDEDSYQVGSNPEYKERMESSQQTSRQMISGNKSHGAYLSPPMSLQEIVPLEELEKRAILDALNACGGNKSTCAKRLGISRSTLQRKLFQYGIEQESS
jgi:two-component system response regulator AtoC